MSAQPITPSPSEEGPREFASFLLEQAKGHSHAELSEGLHDLVSRVKDTGKKGSLTYSVVVEPVKGTTDQVIVKDVIKMRLPEHDRAASIFFTNRAGNLQRNDPSQPSLFGDLAEVPRNTVVVDLSTGEIKE